MPSEVKIKSKSKVKLTVGIIVGVFVAAAIGYGIWNFAGVPSLTLREPGPNQNEKRTAFRKGMKVEITAIPDKCDSAPCEVQFEPVMASGTYHYAWFFGDASGTSFYKAPIHNYEAAGTYNVQLFVQDSFVQDGIVGSATKQIIVGQQPVDDQDVGNQDNPGPINNSPKEEDTGQVQGLQNVSVVPSVIYRGHDRAIVMALPRDENSKKEIKAAFNAKTLALKYGIDKDNLNEDSQVRYDSRTDQYYVVLKKLKGGEKQGYDKNGYNDGRMKYYYRFMIGDKGVYVDKDNTTTMAGFETLNRMQTIAYYYNWIFDKEYNLGQDYDWNKEQNGGLKFWYDTDLSLPGIRFAMINDRKFKVFDDTLGKKKINMNLVTWLYKKILDRIYDDDLYKFAGDGADFWLKQMTEIVEKDRLDKTGVKFGISVSDEYREQLAQSVASAKEAQAEFAYIVVLKRAGDKDGVKYLMDTFNTQLEMRENLFNSQEYNQRLEDIEKTSGKKGAIAELYETVYVRPSDKAGVDYWDQSGKSIMEIKAEFLGSDEFRSSL